MAGSLSENSRGKQAVEISAVFTGLALVIVLLRLYTRFFIIRCAGIEDAGIALAMVSPYIRSLSLDLFAYILPALLHRTDYLYWSPYVLALSRPRNGNLHQPEAKFGMGRHFDSVPPDDMIKFLKVESPFFVACVILMSYNSPSGPV